MAATTWQEELAAALAPQVEAVSWVPDKRLAPIAKALEAGGQAPQTLTREEECIGYACGVRAAGGMPLVMIQCSGLGNSLNALGSLAVPYGLGFPIVVSMRGTLGERNPSQVPLGRATETMFGSLGIECFSLASPTAIAEVVQGALAISSGARQIAPIILEPNLEAA